MVSALVLAILTRKIRHENFKTGSVTVLVYLLSISLLIGFPLYGVLNITDFSGTHGALSYLRFYDILLLFLSVFSATSASAESEVFPQTTRTEEIFRECHYKVVSSFFFHSIGTAVIHLQTCCCVAVTNLQSIMISMDSHTLHGTCIIVPLKGL